MTILSRTRVHVPVRRTTPRQLGAARPASLTIRGRRGIMSLRQFRRITKVGAEMNKNMDIGIQKSENEQVQQVLENYAAKAVKIYADYAATIQFHADQKLPAHEMIFRVEMAVSAFNAKLLNARMAAIHELAGFNGVKVIDYPKTRQELIHLVGVTTSDDAVKSFCYGTLSVLHKSERIS